MLTPQQAAEVLNCSTYTVRRLCELGVLRSINIGTQRRAAWRIYEDGLDDIEEARRRVKAEVDSARIGPRLRQGDFRVPAQEATGQAHANGSGGRECGAEERVCRVGIGQEGHHREDNHCLPPRVATQDIQGHQSEQAGEAMEGGEEQADKEVGC